jgi:hypothetical protein
MDTQVPHELSWIRRLGKSVLLYPSAYTNGIDRPERQALSTRLPIAVELAPLAETGGDRE